MTAAEYIALGFRVSAHLEQSKIDKAEKDIKQAYILPIVSEAMLTDAVVKDAMANLVFLRLIQQEAFATCSGGKTKQYQYSQQVTFDGMMAEQAALCHLKLQAMRGLEGANAEGNITDICRIYFESNFIHL